MFRHLHGTLAQLGVPVAVTQAQLGHADPRITLSIYTHVLPDAQRDAVSRLERFLLEPNGPKLHPKRSAGENAGWSEVIGGIGESVMGATGIEPMTSTVSR